MVTREQQLAKYKYKCVQCGNCCRAGFEIVLGQEDIDRWIKIGKSDYYQFIQIDPKCISKTGLAGYHIEEINTLEILEKKYKDKEYKKKIDELKKFILKNHEFLGNGPPLPIYTFLTELGRTPILVPKNLKIILKGLEWGLVYIIKFEISGYCPFLKENLCSIHKIKPNVCRSFPYNENGELKVDEFFIKICQGLTKN
ncbi:MAG: YkgJ family cysteine cluster protein [Promethearchaeota archaeon]